MIRLDIIVVKKKCMCVFNGKCLQDCGIVPGILLNIINEKNCISHVTILGLSWVVSV
jgi:hypothetical protein